MWTEADAGANYIGCFNDDASRDFEDGPNAAGYNSKTCAVACANYTYYGLRYDTGPPAGVGWCACGNTYGTDTAPQYVQKSDAECGAACPDEGGLVPLRRCGSPSYARNSVYGTAAVETWKKRVQDSFGSDVPTSVHMTNHGALGAGLILTNVNGEYGVWSCGV